MRRTLLVLIFAAVAVTMGAPARAKDTETIGGGGGGAYRVTCGPGSFVVGLSGRSGSWMDRVAPLCARVGADGRWVGDVSTGQAVGGDGGGPFVMSCPRDSVVSSFYGLGRDFAVHIGLTCRHENPLGPNFIASGPAVVGGELDIGSSTGGGCTGGQAANGIIGGAGQYVDRFGLSCSTYLLGFKKPVPAEAQSWVYKNPVVHGVALDWCLNWAADCGLPAANAFCGRQGFAETSGFYTQAAAPPTYVPGPNIICPSGGCTRFTEIDCKGRAQ